MDATLDLLDSVTRERDELRAENERLREGEHLEYSLGVTNAELRAENERLRAALEKIANTEGDIHPSWHVQTARDALGHSKCR